MPHGALWASQKEEVQAEAFLCDFRGKGLQQDREAKQDDNRMLLCMLRIEACIHVSVHVFLLVHGKLEDKLGCHPHEHHPVPQRKNFPLTWSSLLRLKQLMARPRVPCVSIFPELRQKCTPSSGFMCGFQVSSSGPSSPLTLLTDPSPTQLHSGFFFFFNRFLKLSEPR